MEPHVFLNQNISQHIGVKELAGDMFGLELELEGRNVGLADVAVRGWQRHNEPSLRGESIEYTTAGAKELGDLKKSVTQLFEKFKDNGVQIKDSVRAGTHLHLNFSDRTIKQVINFFALFTVLEEVLQYYSGEDRKGNLHCVSSREAAGIVDVLAWSIRGCSLVNFAGDRYKYGACNLSSLYKFGTIEIRTMKGAMSAEQVNYWVDILDDMYQYACKRMTSPVELVMNLSHHGAEGLMKLIFSPDNLKELMRYFPAPQNLHYSLMEGARLIQVFAYEFDEDFTKEYVPAKAVKNNNKKDALPKMFGGRLYGVYKPDGTRWNCKGEIDGPFWEDGERVNDDPRLTWNQGLQRFMFTDRDGNRFVCNWWKHHEIPDEGPPPRRGIIIEEHDEDADEEGFEPDELFEPDFDDEDEEDDF